MKTGISLFRIAPMSLPAITLAAAIALTHSGCTKERPYEQLLKENVESKSLVDTDSEYLYLPSTLESSRSSSASRPHWMGEAKLVKLRFTEKSLDVVEIEQDSRFASNQTNDKLVLSIPVEHVDYKCSENTVGECSNKEEENTKVTWDQKTRFKPSFKDMRVTEVNTLPIQLANLFSMGSCFSESDSRLLSAKIEKDAINIEVERVFSANLNCADDVESLSDLSFSVVHHYSLAKLSSLTSPDYQPVLYPEEDQGKFGFFTTDIKKLSEDNRDRVVGAKTFLNRWNPAKREIVYHLSDGFAAPENAAVKQASFDAVAAINDGLAKAGAQVRLVLKEPSGKNPGDIRNNMIVMVNDPPAIGLLGYGPTAANPRTGEILNGKVVMYLGIVKKTIRTTYEEIRKARATAAQEQVKAGKTAGAQASALSTAVNRLTQAKKAAVAQSKPLAPQSLIQATAQASAALGTRSSAPLKKVNAKEIEKFVKSYTKNVASDSQLQSRISQASRNCLYTTDMFPVEQAVVKGIQEKLGAEELKPWESLTDAERTRVMDILVPYVWKPILVHELGHNMGLRHNFQGSEDKDNFYTAEELGKMGIDHEIPYSTVMEYAARSINELHTIGKYDIAAFRFGYERKVENKDGTIVKVDGTLADLDKSQKDALKDFGYCTDEHVGINAGCKRFDEGTTYADIARFLIQGYEDRYQWRNFRNGARSFSTTNDLAYAEAVDDTFMHLRLFLEIRERLNSRYGLTEAQWKTIPFLKDLDEAVALSANFFLKVVAMPDVHCLVTSKKDPNAAPMLVALTDIDSGRISCFEPDLVSALAEKGFEIVAQGGKSFQSVKAQDNPNPYADQIDVRGIWIDKLLATRYLFARELGVSLLDEVGDNYLSYGKAGDDIKRLVSSILFNRITGDMTLTTPTGEAQTVQVSYTMPLDSSQAILRKSKSTRSALGLPNADTLLSRELLASMKRELPHIRFGTENASMLDAFSVFTQIPNGRAASEFVTTQVGSTRLFALPENEVAMRAINELMAVRTLSQVDEAKLQEILADIAQPANPAMALNDKEKAAKDLGAELITRYLQGDLESENHYALILGDVLLR